MLTQTVCGIDVRAFANSPTPAELGAVVAHWNSEQQAEFFLQFGEQLRNCCGNRAAMQWQHIADSIKELECELCDGSGSQLIEEIHSRIAA